MGRPATEEGETGPTEVGAVPTENRMDIEYASPLPFPRRPRHELAPMACAAIFIFVLVTGVVCLYFHFEDVKEDRELHEHVLYDIGLDLDVNYVRNHNGKYPPAFRPYYLEYHDAQSPGWIESYRTNGMSVAQAAATLDDPTSPHGAFVYVGGYLTESSPGTSVVVYERPEPNVDGIYVLHRDRTVTWLNKDQAKQLIASYANYKPPSTQP